MDSVAAGDVTGARCPLPYGAVAWWLGPRPAASR